MNRIALAGRSLLLALALGAASMGVAEARSSKTPDAYQDLLKESLEKKSGLTFYVNGEIIPGFVMRMDDDGYIEVRNQEHGRVIIRMDRVDAIAH